MSRHATLEALVNLRPGDITKVVDAYGWGVWPLRYVVTDEYETDTENGRIVLLRQSTTKGLYLCGRMVWSSTYKVG